MKITLRNNFHKTECRVRVRALPARLSIRQGGRISHELCGINNCDCGDIRGPQDVAIEYDYDVRGNCIICLSEKKEVAND